ncbi:MFS general substrate transporter [Cylindrobasidium torrendii FP15055 ss-10]|uniref:MFS general substrate transporter n=1 Tax=Cylindrobasidium torrendii FP15055 ss-10 TaxID=1314674 RepID=A0A0D7BMX6_9AGAR|nr:MFS general substrate transporter [Cylindrobasidium torrendii FP15055 ss-10]
MSSSSEPAEIYVSPSDPVQERQHRGPFFPPALGTAESSRTFFDDIIPPEPVTAPVGSEKEEPADPFVVSFTDDDPENPLNWKRPYRWFLTILAGVFVLNSTFASSAPSGIAADLQKEFSISREVTTLVISLFVGGYVIGPLLWGPLSEEYGRRPIFMVSFLVYLGFQIGMALAPNTASLIVFRFLGGVFASGPLTNSGALISDMWNVRDRGKALAVFVAAPFAGPSLGPMVSGFISVSGASWRWLFWTLTIFAGVCLAVIVILIPETYKPIILVRKARRIRKETGDERYYAPMEKTRKTMREQVENVLARPFKMLAREPMLIACTVYMSFIYGCLYLLFEAYPVVFAQYHHFRAQSVGLTFLPILIGAALAALVYVLVFDPMYQKEIDRYAPHIVPAEKRLTMSLCHSSDRMKALPNVKLSSSTSFPHVTFWLPVMFGGLLGFSIMGLYLSFFNYIIDTYVSVAASALAANTVCRSVFGAVFPLFATQMYESMGARWASALVGFVALLMVPIPFIFLKYGAMLRRKSRYAPFEDGPELERKESNRLEVGAGV